MIDPGGVSIHWWKFYCNISSDACGTSHLLVVEQHYFGVLATGDTRTAAKGAVYYPEAIQAFTLACRMELLEAIIKRMVAGAVAVDHVDDDRDNNSNWV